MECSISKIEKHITSLLRKANVKNRVDLVDWWKTYSGTIEDIAPKLDVSSSKQIPKDASIPLTAEETVVMELLESGLTTEEIITKTQSSKKRISHQLSSLFDKAGVRNRTELVRWWRGGGQSTVGNNA
jgi:DNA-binding NarL/FixJ family response regulator